MTNVDRKRIEWAARRLTAAINATTMEIADRRLYRLGVWAVRRLRNMDAAFAATQMLRDLGQIDRAEAAHIFSDLFETLVWRELLTHRSKPDPDLIPAMDAGVEWDLIFAAQSDREMVRKADFHRDRGEESWLK